MGTFFFCILQFYVDCDMVVMSFFITVYNTMHYSQCFFSRCDNICVSLHHEIT